MQFLETRRAELAVLETELNEIRSEHGNLKNKLISRAKNILGKGTSDI